MNDETKPQDASPQPTPEPAVSSNPDSTATPVPDATTPQAEEAPPADGATEESKIQAEPLSDGTVPTVLAAGSNEHHGPIAKGRASIASIYQRADIITTLITFVVALVAAGVVLGGYLYLTRSNKKTVTTAPKITTLDKAELEKLGTFFGGSGGGSSEVLTISSSTLFTNRVALSSDLKVTGGIEASGTTTLGDLTVNKNATLGATTVRGQLNVSGPINLQSPAVLNAGASVKGDVSSTGNGSFGGSLSAGIVNVRDLAVTGNINLAGHLLISGAKPGLSVDSLAGAGASAGLDGNDSAGTVSVNTGSVAVSTTNNGGELVTITFNKPYGRVPRVIITPVGSASGALPYYVQRTANSFTIGAASGVRSNAGYTFDYWIVQ